MIGSHFAGYRILEKIGGGNTGTVYKVFDPRIRRHLAIKILPNDFLTTKERRARFIRETQAAKILSHAAIARLYEIGEFEKMHFLAMEYVDGRHFSEIIAAHPEGVSLETFFQIMQPVLEGVAYAQEQGLVHRDLKPDNIKVNAAGQPKVLDFGLVKFLNKGDSDDPESFQTMAGMVLGSAGYMSPEQARGNDFDQRTDVFSLGIIMYEMLTGSNPFNASSPFATITKVITHAPVSIELLRPDLPPPLTRVICKCLAKDMNDRQQNVRAVAEALALIKG